MNYLNGGYVMLDKADSDIFAKASGALQAGKPILWYEDKNTCYFIDTIEKTGSDSIALTKGGLTIVITSGNVVTENGSIQPKLYKYKFNVSDMYVSFVTSKLYKFETNKEYTINSDSDYTTCLLTGDLLQSLKDALADLPANSCSIVSDNKSLLSASSEQIVVKESDDSSAFNISYINNTLTTDSTGYEAEIYLNIYEI